MGKIVKNPETKGAECAVVPIMRHSAGANAGKWQSPRRAGKQETMRLDECLNAACKEVVASLGYGGELRFQVNARHELDRDAATLIGLIVKEAVANAIRYAHPAGVEGVIRVRSETDRRGRTTVCVTDDGVGLPDGFDPERDGDAGFRVMRALSERVGATLDFETTPLGLSMRLRLPYTFSDVRPRRDAADLGDTGSGGSAAGVPDSRQAENGLVDTSGRARGEDAWRQSERRLRRVLDASAAFIGIVRTDGTLIETNQPALAASGRNRADVINRKIWEGYGWTHDEKEVRRLKESVSRAAGGESVRYDAVVRMKNDALMDISFLLSPVRDDDGEIEFLVASGFDITEQKTLMRHAAEHASAAAAANAKFRAFFEQSSYFAGLMALDGTMLEANQLCLSNCGFERDEIVGRKFWDCGWWNRSPELMARVREGAARAATGETFRQEINYFLADGSERRMDIIISPVMDDEGRILFLAPTGTDITERHRVEAELRAAHDTFRYLVEHSPFGVYAVDADFRLAQVSAGAQKVFQNVRPLVGRDFAEILRVIWPEPFASEAIARFRHTLETGEPYHSRDTTERRADVAETESYDWQIERVMLPDGRFGVVCYFYDLTERRRYEEQIQFLMREVNHRAKNLLSVVQAVARQTARLGDPATFEERLSRRLGGLAASQDLLVRNQWRGVNMDELAHAQLEHLEELIGRRIVIEGPPAQLTPQATQGIGMALHELATNAVKYGALSNDVGKVRLSWDFSETPDHGHSFSMRWSEDGGPAARPPQRSGFGQIVIGSMVEATVGGKVEIEYNDSGLVWRLIASNKDAVKSLG